jgi:hypothetical protein
VASRPGFETVLGRLEPELVEEDLRQVVVVMLARVQYDLLRPVLERQRQGSRLYELGAVADDRKDSHVDRECS